MNGKQLSTNFCLQRMATSQNMSKSLKRVNFLDSPGTSLSDDCIFIDYHIMLRKFYSLYDKYILFQRHMALVTVSQFLGCPMCTGNLEGMYSHAVMFNIPSLEQPYVVNCKAHSEQTGELSLLKLFASCVAPCRQESQDKMYDLLWNLERNDMVPSIQGIPI